jgi:site-specific DNA-methyltransferase (adenine-specific)
MDERRDKERAPRNRTTTLTGEERDGYARRLLRLARRAEVDELRNKTINQDLFLALDYLPARFVDLLFIDPPYNMTKEFGAASFKAMAAPEYADWLASWFPRLLPTLKPTASVYICSDWRSSGVVQAVAEKHLIIRNRITWEREKGRGAKANWKNCSEDIWFCTVSDDFCFNPDAVKLKRRVIAPYKDGNGNPKDWGQTQHGDFRLTCPSNLWTDLTVPFWSMPENTDHPAQKPEKLLAKVILASSREGDFVFDPFLGSGTTSVVAKKLGRFYCGIEIDPDYCCLAEKRLDMAELDSAIQGYSEGVFWERNTLAYQNGTARSGNAATNQLALCLREGRSEREK